MQFKAIILSFLMLLFVSVDAMPLYLPASDETPEFFTKCSALANDAYEYEPKEAGFICDVHLMNEDISHAGYAGRIYFDEYFIASDPGNPGPGTIFIALRGSHSLRDWISDINSAPTEIGNYLGYEPRAHKGFWKASVQVVRSIERSLRNRIFKEDGQPVSISEAQIVFCGHSLAGAMAILAGGEFLKTTRVACPEDERLERRNAMNRFKVVTFSAPMSGNSDCQTAFNIAFGAIVDNKSANIVNFYNPFDPVVNVHWVSAAKSLFDEHSLFKNPGLLFPVSFFHDVGSKIKKSYKPLGALHKSLPGILWVLDTSIEFLTISSWLWTYGNTMENAEETLGSGLLEWSPIFASALLLVGSHSKIVAAVESSRFVGEIYPKVIGNLGKKSFLEKCSWWGGFLGRSLSPLGYTHGIPHDAVIRSAIIKQRQNLKKK